MTKQVSLSDRAYARLRRCRLEGESFSAAVERLIEAQARDPLRFGERVAALHWSTPPDELVAQIEAEREATREPA